MAAQRPGRVRPTRLGRPRRRARTASVRADLDRALLARTAIGVHVAGRGVEPDVVERIVRQVLDRTGSAQGRNPPMERRHRRERRIMISVYETERDVPGFDELRADVGAAALARVARVVVAPVTTAAAPVGRN